jgi:hypothetical protein
MKTSLVVYNNLRRKVKVLYHSLKLERHEKHKGRMLAISIIDTITLALYKQVNNIATKKRLYGMFQLKCSYKTLVVNMNRFVLLTLVILLAILKKNQKHAHLVKHTDSTDIPVCLNKNAKTHKTMAGLAEWGKSSKGFSFGLKLHLTTDLKKRMLAIRFSAGNTDDREAFIKLNKDLLGIFVADAGYISEKLQRDFFLENKRMLLAKPRKNMKKLMTRFQEYLYNTRSLIEVNFRSLKLFYGLATSLPRSIEGYLAHYIHSLLAYVLA